MEETGVEKAGKVILVCFVGFLEKIDVFFSKRMLVKKRPNRDYAMGTFGANTRCYRFGDLLAMKLRMLLECGVCLPLV